MLIINILVAAAMTVSLLFLAMNLGDRMNQSTLHVEEKYAALALQNQIIVSLQNPATYQYMIGLSSGACNQRMACVKNTTDCNANPGGKDAWQPLDCLADPTQVDTVYFDEKVATNGFRLDGSPCNTWSTNPSAGEECVLRPHVEWRPMCTAAPCVNVPLEFRIEVNISSPSGVKYNPGKRAIRFVTK